MIVYFIFLAILVFQLKLIWYQLVAKAAFLNLNLNLLFKFIKVVFSNK